MATEKQIAANQQNAQASTGPKTPGGLKRSSKNAIKHGLTASDVTIFDENAAEFEALLDSYIEAWQPSDAMEMHLVEQLAMATLKLNRAHRMEAQILKSEIKRQQYEAQRSDKVTNTDISIKDQVYGNIPEHLKPNLGSAVRQLSEGRDHMLPLLRYGTAAERSFYRAICHLVQLLERCQKRQRAKSVSVTHVIDGDFQNAEA